MKLIELEIDPLLFANITASIPFVYSCVASLVCFFFFGCKVPGPEGILRGALFATRSLFTPFPLFFLFHQWRIYVDSAPLIIFLIFLLFGSSSRMLRPGGSHAPTSPSHERGTCIWTTMNPG